MRLPRILSPRGNTAGPQLTAAEQAVALAPALASLDFQKLMGRDEVTGLPNRAAFAHMVAQQAALAQRLQTRISLLVITCDIYADFAASHDVAARDRQLVGLARNLRACCRRAYDVMGSLRDGQFAALLPFTDAAGADAVARNMATALRPAPVEATVPDLVEAAGSSGGAPLFGQKPAPMLGYSTLSIGIAAYCGKGSLCDHRMFEVAEEACRIAIAGGGDRALRRDSPLAPSGRRLS